MKINEKGQGLVEYLILVCLIAVTSIVVVKALSKNIRSQYANISNAIQGKGKIELEDVKAGDYKSKGMNDFMDSSSGSSE